MIWHNVKDKVDKKVDETSRLMVWNMIMIMI